MEAVNLHFDQLCKHFGIKYTTPGAWNVQSIAILKYMHQVPLLGNCLRNFDLDDAELDETRLWNECLSAAIFSIKSTVHTSLGTNTTRIWKRHDLTNTV